MDLLTSLRVISLLVLDSYIKAVTKSADCHLETK